MSEPELHLDFAANWAARILPAPPMIAPARSYIWPMEIAGETDALARGAMYVTVRPTAGSEFLAICALGFEHAEMPSGVWSCPCPDEICAVAGGYAYIASVGSPSRPVHVPMRPATAILPSTANGLLLFTGFHRILAWGSTGVAWESEKLSWEGLRLQAIEGKILHGWGWDLPKDREVPFAVDLRTGKTLS